MTPRPRVATRDAPGVVAPMYLHYDDEPPPPSRWARARTALAPYAADALFVCSLLAAVALALLHRIGTVPA